MKGTIEERFWDKVSPEPNSGCWLWVGASSGGYGRIRVRGHSILAHRLAYELFKGPIPVGLEIDHLCRVTFCVNPDHLEPTTSRINILRGLGPELARQRQLVKTHCPQGHPYAGSNLYVALAGNRMCRACQNEQRRQRRKRKRNEQH